MVGPSAKPSYYSTGGLSKAGSIKYDLPASISQAHSLDSFHLYNRLMEVRQLEALVGIAENGTFSRTADALGTVQSNISTRIARLESELGTELVNRSSGTVTESGQVVVERARRILLEIRAIASDVSELNADVSGVVTLGMIGTAGRWVVPLLLDHLRQRYTKINLRISEGTNSALEPRLVNGQLDIAVLAWPVAKKELTAVDLFTEDLVVIASREHPLAAVNGPLPFSLLAQHELLLPMRGTPIRREIDDAAHGAGVELNALVELDGLRTIASMTFDGHGPSILPATMLSPHLRSNFVALPIEGIAKRRVVLASRRFGFPAAPVRAIHALLREVVAHASATPDGVYLPGRETSAHPTS